MAAVLIVDDNEAHCENLARLLRRRGYEVSCAGNGREALSTLARVRPDVILLDVEMPVMGGIAFLERFRGSVVGAVPPVILLSGVEDEQLLVRAGELGVSRVFHKGSGSLDDLIEFIASHIGAAGQRR